MKTDWEWAFFYESKLSLIATGIWVPMHLEFFVKYSKSSNESAGVSTTLTFPAEYPVAIDTDEGAAMEVCVVPAEAAAAA